MKIWKTCKKIQNNPKLDPDLLDNFVLHMHHYKEDIELKSRTVFTINLAMIYGVSLTALNTLAVRDRTELFPFRLLVQDAVTSWCWYNFELMRM